MTDFSNFKYIVHDKYNISVNKLCQNAGVSYGTVSAMMAGKFDCLPSRKKLLDFLHLTEDGYTLLDSFYRNIPADEKETTFKKQMGELAKAAKEESKKRKEKEIKEVEEIVNAQQQRKYVNNEIALSEPDKHPEWLNDTQLMQQKCKMYCPDCGLKCAIGREIIKRGLLPAKTNKERVEETEKEDPVEHKEFVRAVEELPRVSEETYSIWMVKAAITGEELTFESMCRSVLGDIPSNVTIQQAKQLYSAKMMYDKLRSELIIS